jgi:quercetin dioxygenase-like cupin family protein
MMTRREMNGALAIAMTTFFSGSTSGWLQAATLPAQNAPRRAPAMNMNSVAVKTLMEEPLAAMPNAEVSVITLTVAPGATSPPHQHTGPVFAYILEGKIENQVDPNPPQTYDAGQFFYEPPMHVHRSLRNVSRTRPAKLLIFQVGEKGKPFTIGAK